MVDCLQVPMAQYTLGAFAGLQICISGGNMRLKQEQASLIEGAGGTRSPELTKAATHLIINRQAGQREESEKEKYCHSYCAISDCGRSVLKSTLSL